MTPESGDQTEPEGSFLGPRLASLFFLVLGVLVLSQSFRIGRGAGYIVVGPRFFPIVVGCGLLGLGILFFLRTTVIPDVELARDVAAEDAATHWPTVLLLLLALTAYAFALGPLGYTAATTLFFPAVSRLLGSRKLARDLVIGLALGLIVYLLFTRVLGVRLPAGILDSIL
jgi:putative tricarboxylic transport membrane protein